MPRNVISTELIQYKGSTRTLRVWCQTLNLNYLTVRMRYKRMVRPDDPNPVVDMEKLFAVTPVSKHAKNGEQNPQSSRIKAIAAATPPAWLSKLEYQTKRALMAYVDFDTEKLETLLVQLTSEFIDQKVLLKKGS